MQAVSPGTATLGGSADGNSTFSGAITLNGNLTVSQAATSGSNALSITGGIGSTTAGTKTLTFAGPGAINVSTTAIANTTGTVAVSVSGGTTTLSVASTYGGGTTVSGGTLLVTNTAGSGTGTGTVTVNGGTLGGGTATGVGGISGNVTVNSGGTFDPGTSNTSNAILTVGGNVTMSTGSTFAGQMTGTTAGSGYDQLKVTGTGTVNLGTYPSDATLTVTLANGFKPAIGTVFTIVQQTATSPALAGTFQSGGMP